MHLSKPEVQLPKTHNKIHKKTQSELQQDFLNEHNKLSLKFTYKNKTI